MPIEFKKDNAVAIDKAIKDLNPNSPFNALELIHAIDQMNAMKTEYPFRVQFKVVDGELQGTFDGVQVPTSA